VTSTAVTKTRIGISYPWVQTGWDFGVPPHNWDGKWVNIQGAPVAGDTPPSVRPWQDNIDKYLDCFKCLGIEVVRWVLLGDGLNFGTTQWVRDNVWEVISTKLPASFLDDFRSLLEKMQARKLKLLPVVFLPSAFWPGRLVVVYNKQTDASKGIKTAYEQDGKTLLAELRRKDGQRPISWLKYLQDKHRDKVENAGHFLVVKGGRGDILTSKRRQFFDEALVPLLDAAKAYRDNIHAWEVITEPELALAVGPRIAKQRGANKDGTARPLAKDEKPAVTPSTIYYEDQQLVFSQEPGSFQDYEPEFTQEDVRSFLVEAGKQVVAHRFAYTVGFQYAASLKDARWDLLTDKDVPEELRLRYRRRIHYYGRAEHGAAGPLPAQTEFKDGPVALGEFPLQDPAGTQNDPAWQKPDGTTVTALAERLKLIEAAGYQEALGWSARGHLGKSEPDTRSAWTEAIARTIADQNGGSVCRECEATFPKPAVQTLTTPVAGLQTALHDFFGSS
jgi:hypothetical protein